ncbi:hypothetical protein C8J57DRAFT_47629 [Mycena rebaudengoi]|nr:hypothetical protein C8J57DRAFT_47629 [Mycena rebaudengoi]
MDRPLHCSCNATDTPTRFKFRVAKTRLNRISSFYLLFYNRQQNPRNKKEPKIRIKIPWFLVLVLFILGRRTEDGRLDSTDGGPCLPAHKIGVRAKPFSQKEGRVKATPRASNGPAAHTAHTQRSLHTPAHPSLQCAQFFPAAAATVSCPSSSRP